MKKNKNKICCITWRDIYVATLTTLEEIKNELLDKHAIYHSYGEIVHEDKTYIVLLHNMCDSKSDFIIIPKGCIVKIEWLKK